MKKIMTIAAALLLAGCTTLYSTPAMYKGQDGTQLYQFTAETGLGLTGRKITIFNNGKKLMTGKAHYWTPRITMTATLEGKPAAAVCGGEDGAKICTITVAGDEVATLKF